MLRSKSTPAPGQYVWDDHVNMRKRPVWSMNSPERKNLDSMLGTWTPASSSLQPRAPDPGEYGDQSIVGKNGLFFAPKWSYGRCSGRSCLAPDPPEKAEIDLKIPGAFSGKHPACHMPPQWSLYG